MKLKYEREKEELGSDEAAPEVAVQTDIGADFFEEIDDQGINETDGLRLGKKALRTPGIQGLKGSGSITQLRTDNSSTALGTMK